MIHISGDWYIDGDTHNVILKRKRVYEKGKNVGKEYMEEVCYPRDFKQALDILVKKRVRMELERRRSLNGMAKGINEIHKDIKAFCNKYEDHIKKELSAKKK